MKESDGSRYVDVREINWLLSLIFTAEPHRLHPAVCVCVCVCARPPDSIKAAFPSGDEYSPALSFVGCVGRFDLRRGSRT